MPKWRIAQVAFRMRPADPDIGFARSGGATDVRCLEYHRPKNYQDPIRQDGNE